MREFAERVWQHAGWVDCKSRDCRVVVADFTLWDGPTSQVGMQLADQFASAMSALTPAPTVIDRSRLRSYLETERIPAVHLNDDKVMRWLGRALGASALLVGKTEKQGDDLRVDVRLLSCSSDKATLHEELLLPVTDWGEKLTPLEPFSEKIPIPEFHPPPGVFRGGKDNVANPSCRDCPAPSVSDMARAAKAEGYVLLGVTVTREGRAENVTILRGQAWGLNEDAAKAIMHWKFSPATLDGRPVAAIISVEVDFRQYSWR